MRNLTPEQYVEVLNRCLDYLRAHYGERCRLVYRPHPAETQEQERLQLQGFEIENDREVAELYFVKNFPVIEAVYSVSSTVSRVALNYGLNAYALWPCFPFKATAQEYFRTLMDTVPAGFDVTSLAQPPVIYNGAASTAANIRFADVLARALDDALPPSGDANPQKPVASLPKSPRINPANRGFQPIPPRQGLSVADGS